MTPQELQERVAEVISGETCSAKPHPNAMSYAMADAAIKTVCEAIAGEIESVGKEWEHLFESTHNIVDLEIGRAHFQSARWVDSLIPKEQP